MRWNDYLKDRLLVVLAALCVVLVIVILLVAFRVEIELIIVVAVLCSLYTIGLLMFDFLREKRFYDNLLNRVKHLDKAYLVLETMEEANFYEGILLEEALYDINKSMMENIKLYEEHEATFRDYVEMWVHEIKAPLASLALRAHNYPQKYDQKILEQLRRVEMSVERILYYVRGEQSEKDYLLRELSLEEVVHKVLVKYRDDLLAAKMELKVGNLAFKVVTDAKWLEFILGQIVSNSIKYRRDDVMAWLEFDGARAGGIVKLTVRDNGLGVASEDLPRVFEKSFTGQNGRLRGASTGMGLYIANNLCGKLGHKIRMDSEQNVGTKITIEFGADSLVGVARKK